MRHEILPPRCRHMRASRVRQLHRGAAVVARLLRHDATLSISATPPRRYALTFRHATPFCRYTAATLLLIRAADIRFYALRRRLLRSFAL